jgi:hypothetical protein
MKCLLAIFLSVFISSCTQLIPKKQILIVDPVVDKKNEAAGLAGAYKVYIGRLSANCKPYIGKDDQWMNSMVDLWMEQNGKYALWAEKWTSAVVTVIAQKQGISAAQKAANSIMQPIIQNGIAMAGDTLAGSEEQNVKTCANLEWDIKNGKYNIPRDNEIFQSLESVTDEEPN